eukprot:377284_1
MYSAALMIMYIVSVFTNIPWTQQCPTTTTKGINEDPISVLETMDLNVPDNGAFNMILIAAFNMVSTPSIANSFNLIYSTIFAASISEAAMCTGSMCALYSKSSVAVVECYSKSSLFSPSPATPKPIFKQSYTEAESGDLVDFDHDVAINPIDGMIYVMYATASDHYEVDKLGIIP